MVVKIGIEPDVSKRIRQRQGERIRQTRKMRTMSPAELAEAVGVTQGAISQWELGRYAPRHEHQIKIARALDVPWSGIFGLDGEVA